MYSYSICICLGAGPNVSVFYLHLSISKVFAFIFVSADNNHSQRAQMPKQVSKKGNFSAKIWKFLHTLENLTNTICICRQIGKLASICILFVFVRVLGPIYLYSICICQACAFGLFGPICQLLNLFVSDADAWVVSQTCMKSTHWQHGQLDHLNGVVQVQLYS